MISDLITPLLNEIGPDRANYGDQYDLKIDDLRDKTKQAVSLLETAIPSGEEVYLHT